MECTEATWLHQFKCCSDIFNSKRNNYFVYMNLIASRLTWSWSKSESWYMDSLLSPLYPFLKVKTFQCFNVTYYQIFGWSSNSHVLFNGTLCLHLIFDGDMEFVSICIASTGYCYPSFWSSTNQKSTDSNSSEMN